jgi:hypothetical protein
VVPNLIIYVSNTSTHTLPQHANLLGCLWPFFFNPCNHKFCLEVLVLLVFNLLELALVCCCPWECLQFWIYVFMDLLVLYGGRNKCYNFWGLNCFSSVIVVCFDKPRTNKAFLSSSHLWVDLKYSFKIPEFFIWKISV